MLQSAELTNRTAANSILTRHQYQYDGLGRRYRHTEQTGSLGTKYLQYDFDALSRMTQSQTCTASSYSSCTADAPSICPPHLSDFQRTEFSPRLTAR